MFTTYWQSTDGLERYACVKSRVNVSDNCLFFTLQYEPLLDDNGTGSARRYSSRHRQHELYIIANNNHSSNVNSQYVQTL